MTTNEQHFRDYLEKMNRYNYAIAQLYWDMQTALPKKGYGDLSDALSFFEMKSFECGTSRELEELLEKLEQPEEFQQLGEALQFSVKKMARELKELRRIPKDFQEKMVLQKVEASRVWTEAKRSSDFALYAPVLDKTIQMSREQYQYTDPDRDIYDAMLDDYEKGVTREDIDRIFGELKEGLKPLLDRILSAPQPDESRILGNYDIEKQKELQHLLLSYIGFDWEAGAVAESEHPFTMDFSRQDVRLTNHYHLDDLRSSIFSAIHEGGHAIFQQNTDPALDHTPAEGCENMGLHESQSRFLENILGRNRGFWVPIYPQVQELFPQLQSMELDEFVRQINCVKPSMIRTEADEVTYCFHVILRYEMERGIFQDHWSVEELPQRWNEKMKEYLGIVPQTDSQGILQDMHWSDGSFGYFPSYLLGSVYDGMFLEAMEQDLGNVEDLLAGGGILQATDWLHEKIHRYGNLRTSPQVIKEVCHKDVISAKPLLNYFEKKYKKLYFV